MPAVVVALMVVVLLMFGLLAVLSLSRLIRREVDREQAIGPRVEGDA